MTTNTFGDWLKHQLRRREWSQADLARRLESPPGVVSHWIRGSRKPDPASCDRIADVLGLDVDTVLIVAGHRPNIEAVSLDDPRVRLHGMIDRIQWDDERSESIEGILQVLLNQDRRKRAQ